MVDPTYVDEELSKARDALRDADALRTAGGSDEGIVNRLYYAAFHAAQAALYDRDVDLGSHGAVRNRFGEVYVTSGEMDREHGRLLTTLADLRQQADYGYESLDVDVGELRDRVADFIAAVAGLGA